MARAMTPRAVVLACFLLCLVPPCVSVHRVAILGGGIGGASCAYYLSKFALGSTVDVFEKEAQVGGRMKHVTFGGEVCEVGADAWSTVNTYLMQIMEDLNIQISNDSYGGNGKIGFWEGNGNWYKVKKSIFSEVKFLLQVDKFKASLAKNYQVRGVTPFTSIEEFVSDGELDAFTTVQTDDFMEAHGIDYTMVWGEVLPVIRGIYDQNLTVSAFAGFVSMLPALTNAYSVEGGNSLLVEKMLNTSNAEVHLNSPVTQVSWTGSGYQITSNGTVQGTYDSIVLAHPFEFSTVAFTNVTLAAVTPRHYAHWFVTLVLATGLQPSYFGKELNPIPDNVFTTGNSTAPFVVVYPIARSKAGPTIYKIFSNVDMTQYLKQIFINMTDYHVQVWPYTFPDLSPQKSYQPINLANGIYYLNTLESVASAMETSTISGRNTALLIANKQK